MLGCRRLHPQRLHAGGQREPDRCRLLPEAVGQRDRHRGEHRLAGADLERLAVVDAGGLEDDLVITGGRQVDDVLSPLALHLLLEVDLFRATGPGIGVGGDDPLEDLEGSDPQPPVGLLPGGEGQRHGPLEHEIEGHRVADRPLQERPVGRGGPGERTELIGATGDDKLPLVDDPPDLGVGHEGFEGRPVGIRQRAAGERGGWRNQSVWSLPGGSAAARAATALVNPPVALSESSRGGVECRHRHTLNPLCPPPRIDESWEVKDLIL